jgi:hypothetical protein
VLDAVRHTPGSDFRDRDRSRRGQGNYAFRFPRPRPVPTWPGELRIQISATATGPDVARGITRSAAIAEWCEVLKWQQTHGRGDVA